MKAAWLGVLLVALPLVAADISGKWAGTVEIPAGLSRFGRPWNKKEIKSAEPYRLRAAYTPSKKGSSQATRLPLKFMRTSFIRLSAL